MKRSDLVVYEIAIAIPKDEINTVIHEAEQFASNNGYCTIALGERAITEDECKLVEEITDEELE